MDQPGVEIRPITQLTGTSEFNEVFFDGARTAGDNVVGRGGRRLAGGPGHPGLRARAWASSATSWPSGGSSTTSSTWPGPTARSSDPVMRQRLARSYAELEILRSTPCAACPASTARWPRRRRRSSSCTGPPGTSDLGELAMDVLGPAGLVADGSPTSSTSSSAPSCSAGPTPSTAAPTRSSTTSSASGSSACRPSPRGPHDDRRHRRHARHRVPAAARPPRARPARGQGGGHHRRGRHRHRLRHRQAVRRGGGHGGDLRRPRAPAGRGGRRPGRAGRGRARWPCPAT